MVNKAKHYIREENVFQVVLSNRFEADLEITGASPETKVKLQNEKALLFDPKELAEHNMRVDLGRNDLGRISKFGTVKVKKYLFIERFSHVMHIGSTVKGEIMAVKH